MFWRSFEWWRPHCLIWTGSLASLARFGLFRGQKSYFLKHNHVNISDALQIICGDSRICFWCLRVPLSIFVTCKKNAWWFARQNHEINIKAQKCQNIKFSKHRSFEASKSWSLEASTPRSLEASKYCTSIDDQIHHPGYRLGYLSMLFRMLKTSLLDSDRVTWPESSFREILFS